MIARQETTEESTSIFTAKNQSGQVIFIQEATSGRGGYYCQGCHQELVARKGSIIIHHFAHLARDVEQKQHCTFADEDYRLSIAQSTLQRIKQIRVPRTLLINPEVPTQAIQLQPPRNIHAHRVEVKFPLCLNGQGQIETDRLIAEELISEGVSFVRPNISFFNNKDQPVLAIELLTDGKQKGISAERKALYTLLGIDAIQVILPKESAQAIEDTFFTTKNTFWLYNDEYAHTTYPSTSTAEFIEGVSDVDRLQIQLLEEDAKCRANRLRNLIRSIRKYLDSNSAQQVAVAIQQSIGDLERQTERVDQQLRERTEQLKEQVRTEFASQVGRLRDEEASLDQQEETFRVEEERVESAYHQETERIDGDIRDICERHNPAVDTLNQGIRDTQRALDNLSSERIKLDQQIPEFASRSYRLRESIAETKYTEGQLKQRIETTKERIKRYRADDITKLETDIQQLERELAATNEAEESQIQREIDSLKQRAQAAISQRDSPGLPQECRELKDFFSGWASLSDYNTYQTNFRRLRQAKQEFDSSSWKTWYKA